jgi:hypothetical protein
MPNRIQSELAAKRTTRQNAWSSPMKWVLQLCLLFAVVARAQTPDLTQVLERLDRLEAENQQLVAEVRALKDQLAALQMPPPAQPSTAAQQPAGPSIEDRLEVQESRTAEQAAIKVESAHRFPIRITGMALFNSYLNSHGGASQYATVAAPGAGSSAGATFRQSIVGLEFNGPTTFAGGKVNGSLYLDLFGRSASSSDALIRLRTASVGIDWPSSSFSVGVEKPLISPREPESLAQVGISPLSGAGNLWYWIPQARFSQSLRFGKETGVQAQVAVVQTHEIDASAASPYAVGSSTADDYAATRPGVESRLEFFHGSDRRIEIATGVHHSVSHIAGASAPSDAYSADWLIRPMRAIEFTGELFAGRNVAPLGTGAIRQGVIRLGPGRVAAVRSAGGWGQLTLHAAPRLWFNLFSGQQDDRNSGLPVGAVGKNIAFGGNVFLRLAPNVLSSFEYSQTRTAYIAGLTPITNHYDLAFAYLF